MHNFIEFLMRLHKEGIAIPLYTVLAGKYAIRVAIIKHWSRKADFEALAEATVRIGKKMIKSENWVAPIQLSYIIWQYM